MRAISTIIGEIISKDTSMTVNQFMNSNMLSIASIISQIKLKSSTFDTHEFIKHFSKSFEIDYINLLSNCGSQSPFQTIHQQIGRFLADNQAALGIVDNGTTCSANIFGLVNQNEDWTIL